MRIATISLLLFTIISILPGAAFAETTAQIAAAGFSAPDDPNVNGFRLSLLYGENDSMGGLDVGFVSVSESAELSGVALVLGMHKLNSSMTSGAAFALVNLHEGNDTGLNAAFINLVNDVENGVDFGFVNIAGGTTLVDIGGFNMAESSTAQLGFINVTDEIKGFQLGFLNVAKNGFLPVFPFFNFPMP